MEIKEENVIIVQFKDPNSGDFVNDIYAKVEVSLAAYDKGRLLYTSDGLGYTKFVTEVDGFGVINVNDLLILHEKKPEYFLSYIKSMM